MNPQEIMCLYNEYERRKINIEGLQKVASSGIVKFISRETHGSFISYYSFLSENADTIIEKEVTYFSNMSRSFEWKTYDTDRPSQIGEKLVAYGFTRGEPESLMILDIDSIDQYYQVPDGVIEVDSPEGIDDVIAVQESIWGSSLGSQQKSHLNNFKRSNPSDISIYVIYENCQPVSSAWIIYNGKSPFAGLWGGSTLNEYRRKGYYSALLYRRINDAKRRGKKYLTIDASEMSKPIVESHGFKFVTNTTPYTYEKS